MKAIILTYAPVDEHEKEILKETNIFKLAINQHAEEFKPHMRICSDWILKYLLRDFPEDILSVRERLRCPSKRVKYSDIEFKGSTIISAIEWLIQSGYNDILIIGDNTVNHKEFQEIVKDNITQPKSDAGITIWQYKYGGNFDLPVKSITNFLKEDN